MKTVLVTGSTDGIGKLCAVELAKAGHHVWLHGRNPEKLNAVVDEIETATGNGSVKGFIADFADAESVRQMILDVNDTLPKLDVLINNAGVFKTAEERTAEGLDVRFAVNYLAPVMLTEGLVELLKKSDAPRVLNLSSAAQSPVSLDALAGTETVDANAAYAQSKLALTMWNNHMAVQEPKITFIAVNPGSLLDTRMVAEAYGRHWSPAEKGSNVLFELALEDQYSDASGKYFDNDQGDPKGDFADAHDEAYDETLIAELITATNALIG